MMLAYNFTPTSLISHSLHRRLDDRRIMQITRIEEATANSAPLPRGPRPSTPGPRRDQHRELLGRPLALPPGTAPKVAAPFKMASVVTEDEVTISNDDDEQLLGQMDSCVITSNELRAVVNNTNRVATMRVNGLTRP